jgi:hypothetical protein
MCLGKWDCQEILEYVTPFCSQLLQPSSIMSNDQDADSTEIGSSRSSTKPKLTSKYSDESTPLLSRDPDREEEEEETASERTESIHEPVKRWRIPTIISIAVLMIVLAVILALGFAMPAVMKEYAEQAATFEPKELSLDTITTSGVKARVKGDFVLDPSKVGKKATRDLGKFGTWIARGIEVRPTNVYVELPEGDLLGKAEMPPLIVWIRPNEVNHLDLLVDVQPGFDGIRRLAQDWVEGRLDQLRVVGKADVGIKSGLLWLGTQSIMKEVVFKKTPTLPKYNISKLNVHEDGGIIVDVSASIQNDYPLSFLVPPLAFEILVPGCSDLAFLANATTEEFEVIAGEDIKVDAQGFVTKLPTNIVSLCPDSMESPLDQLVKQYMSGKTKFFIHGTDRPETPTWISDISKSVTVPISFGRPFKSLVKNFTMSDVHFSLPNPLAEPGTPESNPRISAEIQVVANLPEEMNFPVSVKRVRSKADVFFKGNKLGSLDLKWQDSISRQSKSEITVQTKVKDAPLNITDEQVLQDVISDMLFGQSVTLSIEANVDIETSSALGTFVVRDIPAKGKVPLKR